MIRLHELHGLHGLSDVMHCAPPSSMDAFNAQIKAATAAHLATMPVFSVGEAPEQSFRNKCSITAAKLFAHFSGSPPAFEKSTALENGAELFSEVAVCAETSMKIIYVNLEGTGSGDGHRFCILGHLLPSVDDGKEAPSVYAILQSNANANMVYVDGLPHIYALGDRPPVIFNGGEFAAWWDRLANAVKQRDVDVVGALMGVKKMPASKGCTFQVANCMLCPNTI